MHIPAKMQLTIFQVYNEGMSDVHKNIPLHLCSNSVSHCIEKFVDKNIKLFTTSSSVPFSDAFFRTFIAYIFPASLPSIFLTKNTYRNKNRIETRIFVTCLLSPTLPLDSSTHLSERPLPKNFQKLELRGITLQHSLTVFNHRSQIVLSLMLLSEKTNIRTRPEGQEDRCEKYRQLKNALLTNANYFRLGLDPFLLPLISSGFHSTTDPNSSSPAQ